MVWLQPVPSTYNVEHKTVLHLPKPDKSQPNSKSEARNSKQIQMDKKRMTKSTLDLPGVGAEDRLAVFSG
jgi:hypothetical protein